MDHDNDTHLNEVKLPGMHKGGRYTVTLSRFYQSYGLPLGFGDRWTVISFVLVSIIRAIIHLILPHSLMLSRTPSLCVD